MTIRREFPVAVKRAAWARAGGNCEGENCGIIIMPGIGPEYDHRIEDAIGGEPTIENCVVLCIDCHKAKTKAESQPIAKTLRLERKAANIRPRKAILPGSKASKFKKRLDGSVVRRGQE